MKGQTQGKADDTSKGHAIYSSLRRFQAEEQAAELEKRTSVLEFRFPPGCSYPRGRPIVTFRNPSLAPEVCLAVTCALLRVVDSYAGEPALYSARLHLESDEVAALCRRYVPVAISGISRSATTFLWLQGTGRRAAG